MSAHMLGHLVRRGVDAAASGAGSQQQHIANLQKQAQAYEESPYGEVPPWVGLMFLVTIVAAVVMSLAVSYTVGDVIRSLAMIEQPNTAIVTALPPYDEAEPSEPDAPLYKQAADEEVVMVAEKPVTASIRRSLKLLTSINGISSCFRGLGMAIIYSICHGVLAGLIAPLFSMLFNRAPLGTHILANFIATILLARLHMTWTHIMISKPSPQSQARQKWYQRIPRGRAPFKAVVLPTVVLAIAQLLMTLLPAGAYMMVQMPEQNMPSDEDVIHIIQFNRILTAVAVFLLTLICLWLPASVTLTRIEASFLPDDYETLVNFDRTLGGASIASISLDPKGTQQLFLSAWRTFDRASRGRLLLFFTKAVMIQMLVWAAFVAAIAGEIMLVGPNKLGAFARAGSAQIQLMMLGAPQD